MILYHVAHYAGFVVVAAAVFNGYRLGDGNPHIVDVVAIPDRLKYGIRKPKDQQVLNHMLSKVVVNAKHLSLIKEVSNETVKFNSRLEIVAKWLFDDHSAPTRSFIGKTVCRHIAQRRLEQPRSDGQVKEPVCGNISSAVQFMKSFLQDSQALRLAQIAAYVMNATCELLPLVSVCRQIAELADLIPHEFSVRLTGIVRAREADDSEIVGNALTVCQFKECGNQFALRKISCAAENDYTGAFLLGHHSDFLTLCPPNWFRIAASSFAPNGDSCLERKRACNDAAMTGIGTAKSIDSSSVHRPSPESSTYA